MSCWECLMRQNIIYRWPKLEGISEKLVGVYLMLSSGQHSDDSEKENLTEVLDFTTVKTSGRLVSTRDLMKWCYRVACTITNTDMTVANRAFQVCKLLLCMWSSPFFVYLYYFSIYLFMLFVTYILFYTYFVCGMANMKLNLQLKS